MIDIHCHILYGMDDGAKDMQESLAMARMAYDDGIRHIIATPHFNAHFFNHQEIVLQKVYELQKKLNQQNILLTIHPGNEVRLESAEYIFEHAQKENFLYLGPSSKFILLEQMWKAYAEDTLKVVRWFLQQGTVPIIPHPERHFFFREHPDLLTRLLYEGCWTQVSVDSLLGKNSQEATDFSNWLIDNNMVHTLATDAHNVHRKPNLSEGFQIIKAMAGQKRVDEIAERMSSILKV